MYNHWAKWGSIHIKKEFLCLRCTQPFKHHGGLLLAELDMLKRNWLDYLASLGEDALSGWFQLHKLSNCLMIKIEKNYDAESLCVCCTLLALEPHFVEISILLS